MKYSKLSKIILSVIPSAPITKRNAYPDDNTVLFQLHGSGSIDINILDEGTRHSFFYFNTFGSDLRVDGQNSYNGKYNYFGKDPEGDLKRMLELLREKLQEQAKQHNTPLNQ